VPGEEVQRGGGLVTAGVGARDRVQDGHRGDAVGGGAVDVEHEDVAAPVTGQAGAQRRGIGHGDDPALKLGARVRQGVVVVAVDDLQQLASRGPARAQHRRQRGAQAPGVERAGDPRFEMQAPRRRRGVEQIRFVALLRAWRNPLAVEHAAVIALPAAQQPDEVTGHADDVVQDRAAQRVAGVAVAVRLQRRHLVDVRGHPVAVDGDVQALLGHVLAQRHHPAVKEAAERAVAVKVPAGVELAQQRDGFGDRRTGGGGLGAIGAAVAGVLQTRLQRRGGLVGGGRLRLHADILAHTGYWSPGGDAATGGARPP
jgi:hypothetical protein